jgi:VCBS repeat protein
MRNPRIAASAGAVCVLLLASQLTAHAFDRTALSQSRRGPPLRPAGNLQTAHGTSAMVSADVDGDGHLDLIVANADEGTVSIFRGDGTGQFSPRRDLAAGARPFAVAVGDMNGDGIADLAVGNEGDHTVSLMLGRGRGAFEDARSIPVGTELRALAFRASPLGDHLLVMRDQAVEVLTLEPGGEITTTTSSFGCGFGEVLVGDFDADRIPDLLGIGSVSMAVMRGREDGTFAPHQDLFWQSSDGEYLQFWWAASGDMNGDGVTDIVAGTYHHGQQFVDVGVWSAGAVPGPRVPSPDLGLPVAVGDIDGDGHADMVAVNSHSSGFTLFRGDGSGAISTEAEYATGGLPFKAEIGDFDEDGKADVAILNYESSSISLFTHARRRLAEAAPVEPVIVTDDSRPRIDTITPSPARTSEAARIEYDVPRAAEVALRVYDAAGRRVTDLAGGSMTAGRHAVEWTAPAPGVYFLRLTVAGRHAVRSMAVIR